jgi:hypothetical protein
MLMVLVVSTMACLLPLMTWQMDLPTIISPVSKQVCWAKSNIFLADDLALISRHLKFLSDRLSGLPVPPPPLSDSDPVAPKLLTSLSHDEVV